MFSDSLDLPALLVRVTGFDLLGALVSDRIAIVTHQTITPELEQFKHLFTIRIRYWSQCIAMHCDQYPGHMPYNNTRPAGERADNDYAQ